MDSLESVSKSTIMLYFEIRPDNSTGSFSFTQGSAHPVMSGLPNRSGLTGYLCHPYKEGYCGVILCQMVTLQTGPLLSNVSLFVY